MLYVLGILTGLVMSIFILGTIVVFQPRAEQLAKPFLRFQKKNKGYIIDVPTQREEARQRIIQRNGAMGRTTELEELE